MKQIKVRLPNKHSNFQGRTHSNFQRKKHKHLLYRYGYKIDIVFQIPTKDKNRVDFTFKIPTKNSRMISFKFAIPVKTKVEISHITYGTLEKLEYYKLNNKRYSTMESSSRNKMYIESTMQIPFKREGDKFKINSTFNI